MGSILELYKILIMSMRTQPTHEHLESVRILEIRYTPCEHPKSRLIMLKKMTWDSKKKITHAHLLKIIQSITAAFKEIPLPSKI